MILIDTIIDVVGGKLINTPTISHFNSITASTKELSYGDIFVAMSLEEALDVIDRGVYGVICEPSLTPYLLKYEDIAIIEVASSYDALLSLVRFKLSSSKLEVFLTTKVAISILKENLPKKIVVLDKSTIINSTKEIIEPKNSRLFIVSRDIELLRDVYPSFIDISSNHSLDINLNNSSIFSLSLLYKNRLYDSIKIPYLFRDDFIEVLKIFDYLVLDDINFYDFRLYKSFHPIFVDSKLNYLSFGKGSRVLVFETQEDLIEKGLESFLSEFSWAKSLIVFPKKLEMDSDFNYNSIEEVREFLLTSSFSFAYIYVDNIKTVKETLLESKEIESSLF
jgi:ferrochelatase